jgi:predicted RNA-binding protein associated with RNAse of E/G family
MNNLRIYRKRIIPEQCLLLKDDVIVERTNERIVTSWNTINPKVNFTHGCSCYFLNHGIKVSKFYREDNSLLYWYCDIVDYEYNEESDSLIVTDLLADVVIYPDGRVYVADLDELADALERGLITNEQMCLCLRRLNNLLTLIDRDKFDKVAEPLDRLGL